jgi:hypothetical protein
MVTTPARADEPIEAKTLSITKVVTSIGAVSGLGVAAALQQLGDQSDAVLAATVGFLGLVVLAVGMVVAVDISARARVTMAKEQTAARTPAQAAPSPEPSARSHGAVISSVNTPITLTVQGAGTGHCVIAVRWDEQTDQTYYLAGRPGDAPQWRAQDEISHAVYSLEPAAPATNGGKRPSVKTAQPATGRS